MTGPFKIGVSTPLNVLLACSVALAVVDTASAADDTYATGAKPAWWAEANQPVAKFGASVGGAGDVNGDGFADIVIGAPYYLGGETRDGWAVVYHGSAEGLEEGPAWSGGPDEEDGRFGYAVSGAGDVDDDGFDDVLVGAPKAGGSGRAYLYYGSGDGLEPMPGWSAGASRAAVEFGKAVAGVGDVDGDGYDDVLVGAPVPFHHDGSARGCVHLYRGSEEGLEQTPSWRAVSEAGDSRFGSALAGAGDVDGDGVSDVVIGAPEYPVGQGREGVIYVYHGSSTGGLSHEPETTVTSTEPFERFGRAVAGAGDVDGDGFDDIVVGAPRYGKRHESQGRAYVFHGGEEGLQRTPGWSDGADRAGARYGAAVAGAGDVDGDGFDDLVVGDLGGLIDANPVKGRLHLYRGTSEGVAGSPSWTAISRKRQATFGVAVAGAGDVDADGFADMLVGASTATYGESLEGAAYLYPGMPADEFPATATWGTGEADGAGDGGCGCRHFEGSPIGDGVVVMLVAAAAWVGRRSSWVT